MALPSSVRSLDRSSLNFVYRKSKRGLRQFGQPSVAVQPASALRPLRICSFLHIWGQQQHWLLALQLRPQADPMLVAQESVSVDPSAFPEEVPEDRQAIALV